MSRIIALAAILLLIPFATTLRADEARFTLPAAEPSLPVSIPAQLDQLPAFSFPWDTNALGDSLDYSGPPDGALFVARQAGPDSSVIILGYNYNNAGWWERLSISTNSGRTFTPVTLDSGFYVDVCLNGNGRDTVYTVAINYLGGYHLFIRRSTDDGVTWSDTVRVDRGTSTFTDKPMFTGMGSRLYCTYTDFSGGTNYIRICRSSDWGQTWNTGDINVSSAGGQGSCPAAGPDSNVYVVWGQPASWVPRQLWFNRSTDYGVTWGTARQIGVIDTAPHMYRWRANHSFPAMVVDTTGKIYVTVQNRLHGLGYDVAVYTSTNNGDSWQGPYLANDDSVMDSDQYCSWITLDRYQRPHVFWYDNRNYYPDSTGDVYYSWSEDGGVTWQPNEQVNDVSPCWSWRAKSMMGDYQQIGCDTHHVYCEWSDHRNGRNSWSYIAAARRPLPAFVGQKEPEAGNRWEQSRFVLGQNAPNPVVRGTRICFELEQAQAAELKVIDLAGRPVRTVFAGNLSAGRHDAYWDARDDAGRQVSSGVYYYRLKSGAGSATRRLVLSR